MYIESIVVSGVKVPEASVTFKPGANCSGLMKPDTLLGENTRQIEVSDDQTTPYLFR